LACGKLCIGTYDIVSVLRWIPQLQFLRVLLFIDSKLAMWCCTRIVFCWN